MPQLHNIKHEKFCKCIVMDGLSAPNAYAAAGFVRSRQNAHSLLQRQDVKLRIDELRAEQEEIHAESRKVAVEKAAITLEGLIEQAQEIQRLAVQDKVYGAAVSSLREVGVLTGYRIERQLSKAQVQQVGGSIEDLDDFSLLEQRVQMTLRMAQGLGLDPAVATVEQYCSAMLEAFEREQDEPRTDFGRPISNSRGVRATDYRRLPPPDRPRTKGEAAAMARKVNGKPGVAR
jgi:hypothetical protein